MKEERVTGNIFGVIGCIVVFVTVLAQIIAHPVVGKGLRGLETLQILGVVALIISTTINIVVD